jgi:hypothetical protein
MEVLQGFGAEIAYIPGPDNPADALSRRADPMGMSSVSSDLQTRISEGYAHDPFFKNPVKTKVLGRKTGFGVLATCWQSPIGATYVRT